MKKLLLLAIVVLGISAVSFGQIKSATALAGANIVSAINMVKVDNKDLDFGSIVAGVAGTVTMPHTGTRTTSAPVLVPQGAGHQAEFKITGTAGTAYTFTVPSTATEVSTSTGTGTKTMSVSGWVHSGSGTIPGGGEEIIRVGGVLTLVANQAVGVYTSATPFEVTVNYN